MAESWNYGKVDAKIFLISWQILCTNKLNYTVERLRLQKLQSSYILTTYSSNYWCNLGKY